jgi:signal transduction histidine kinase
LLVFLLAALAAILLVFSVSLYGAARWYVSRETEERTNTAAATLVAAVDIEPDSVDWEPSDRHVTIGPGPLGGTVYWFITDAQGHAVDHSPQPGTDDLLAGVGAQTGPEPSADGWYLVRRLIHPPGKSGRELTRDRTEEEIEKLEYPALVFTVGVRIQPLQSALNNLAAGLAVVSLVIWLAALAVGRGVIRRALRPVAEMAAAARAIRAEGGAADLPPPGTRGELDDLHTAVNGLIERLRSALERERRFTAEASHQLRTPLGAILGQVEVALRRPRTQEEYEKVLATVRRQSSHMARTVEALLFLARTESDAQPPSLETIDLREWLAEFARQLGHHPRHTDLSFVSEAGSPQWVKAHPPLLRELVGNLVENAFKYSPAGTPVDLRLVREGERVVLAVEDRGPGIPPADLPHLFEPFFRSSGNGAGSAPGAGLGLSVATRIAAAFGARLEAQNRDGGGARFLLSFSAATAPSRIEPAEREDKEKFIPASRST